MQRKAEILRDNIYHELTAIGCNLSRTSKGSKMETGFKVDPGEDFHVVIKPMTLHGNSCKLKQILKSVNING